MDALDSQELFAIVPALTPIVVGEALIDAFADGREIIGGAPLNVAWNLHGLGQTPLFVSKVGKDSVGDRIVSVVESWGLPVAGIARTAEQPTGVVSVRLTDGVPEYEIVYPVAYDFIDGPKNLGVELPSPAMLYLGSLAWRRADSLDRLAAWLEDFGDNRFVDINLRAPWFDERVIAKLADGATILKLNDEELAQLTSRSADTPEGISDAVDVLRSRWRCETVLVTCGSMGAWAITEQERYFSPAAIVDRLVDTVGAGDAFASAVMDGRLRNMDWQTCLDRGVRFAARICGIGGATSKDPSLYVLENNDGVDQGNGA